MPRDPSPRGARRSPSPPAPLPAEVVRARLVDALAARFDVDFTVVVAGAGFGKTTALAQALRANEAAPRGIDAWVACEPSDEDATRLGAAVAGALGSHDGPADPLERALDALRRTAPVDTCLVLDDLHELPAGSPGERFVVELATHLPAHAHLVLASRTPVPVPLARRRAAGQVAEIDADALAFTDAEVTSLTRLVGGDEGACAGLAGWPSLVRLVLSAPTGAMRQFLWEEIVTRLDDDERAGLLALATLGSGSASELTAVAGVAVDADALVTRVPLLHRDARDHFGAHHLWDDAALRIYAPAEVAAARRRALTVLAARRDTVGLGAAAVRWGDAGAFCRACVALVREGLGAFAIDTGERWLAGAPAGAVGSPEHRLLELAVRQARQLDVTDIDASLDTLEAAFVGRGDRDCAMVTLALAAVVAHGRGDALRILALAERIRALPQHGDDEPLLVFFLAAVDAAVASLRGDVTEVLRILDAVDYDAVPPPVTELVVRLHAVMRMLAGRADESEPLLRRLRPSANRYVRAMPTMLHWAAGDPSRYLATRPDPTPPPDLNERDRLAFVTHVAAVATSLGDRARLDAVRAALTTPDGGRDPRDSVMVAVAAAMAAVADHDENAAAAAVGAHLDRHPLAGALGEAHLRRHLAVPYVLDARVRDRWSTADLGPVHRRVMALGDALLAGRRGASVSTGLLADAGFVLCALPLPWSVELAVHAHAAGDDDATVFVRTLDGWLGEPVRDELVRLTAATTTAAPAAALLARLPAGLARPPLHVDLLGPLRLRCGDHELLGDELRRARVRALLALLALLGPQRRERVADLLWPALAGDAAAQNLRVTLSRVRRLLRAVDDDADAWLLVRGDQVGLAGPPLVVTDLDRFRRHVDTAARARRAGDSGAEQDELTAAVACWRGEPLADLHGVDEARAAVEGVRRQLIDTALRLGELRLVGGDADGAVALAERARDASPFLERAHRLAIAGLLRRNDPAALRAAVDTALAALDELGVAPEDTTRMVLRNAEARLGGSRTRPL